MNSLRPSISRAARLASTTHRARYLPHWHTLRRLQSPARLSTRTLSFSPSRTSDRAPSSSLILPPSDETSPSAPSAPATQTKVTLETPEPRLSLTFTCTVPDCSTRSTHEFTRRSYERGIVIVECPGCQNRHLIADHLGWFKESTEEGTLKTVEDLMRAKGEKVKRGRIDAGGVVEYAPE